MARLSQHWLFRAATQLGIALLVLGVLEVMLGMVASDGRAVIHQYDRELFWRLKPGLQGIEQPSVEANGRTLMTSITTNALGLRDEEIPSPKPSGEYRALVLGDSSIFGHGVKLEETFVKQLQDRLQKAYPDRKVRVVNGGVSGYSSFQGRLLLAELKPKIEPDLVILAYYFSDLVPDVIEDRRRVAPGAASSDWMRAMSRSNLYQFLKDWMLEARLDSWNAGQAGMVSRVSPEDYRANLAALLDAAAPAKGVLLLLDPEATPIPSEQKPYREAASRLAKDRSVPLVDMHQPFAKHKPRDDLFLDDVHPTPLGNTIIADELFEAVQKAGL